jgi:nitrite reductase/ring-hydroxylating ferredoxin subunit
MARFVEVARVEDLPPGGATVVQVGGSELALVNVNGTFFAIDNASAPTGGGFSGEGEINADWND